MDWAQLWEIVSLPDNIPIVAIAILVPFYLWLGLKQAFETDQLIGQLESDPKMAKTHHRKIHPYKPGWAKEVPVWPYLLKIEFLAAVIVTLILMVWSILLDAPLEEPANPNHTMNPAKAPWYFVGLQEMLVYFDPWFAGVVLPSLILVGLMVFPYVDSNPLGSGYYSIKQRVVSLWGFGLGLFVWLLLIFIGTFVRGPGWMWFWPGQTWDHTRVIYEVNRNLPDLFGITNPWIGGILGVAAIGAFYGLTAWAIHWFVLRSDFDKKIYERTSTVQYLTFQFFAITILIALPVKMVLRLIFRIQYVLVTPWFNV
jgi:cytochrome b/b6/petD-like protein